ncbi:hypothetical protein ACFQJC_16750 [Haloferax namakaokahaiae]|uniref:Uncharacterized protein n=1 Tax=Haloferax namakaokahaiae TaxID=1748331 RepID=A0ABD5ZIN9_9EURY
MSASSIPTGTVSSGGSGARTYPRDDGVAVSRSPPRTTTDAERLQRRNEALRKANERLRRQLAIEKRDRQSVIDGYEHLLSEAQPPRREKREKMPTGVLSRLKSFVRRLRA